ncbi:lipopolysaccharide heptosyltransferase I [Uliginosibacterium sp. 31-16]|uniref:lipopolysaccharide heptosyltransferase I n=1 Tax=Uliginosibacterium sp. 31-16 TaxID=3068315 RepID=UPI00273D8CAE|nr:lipopolysaccharide heptosyltransferase I [Uliginosibacterium sp. 31-16]MDP5238387.1 lipopolysaccharide heptosyltransferase I [Uliginosibacterium sp. 31-16]
MRSILLVKTSSLGDVIHNLPVVSDLRRIWPNIAIDWVVEENFAEIPRLHPGVRTVFPVAIRRWRKALGQKSTWQEIAAFRRAVRANCYDIVLDTQGLVKSGVLTWLADGLRCGYSREVAREPLAALFYDCKYAIPPNAHAVERNRWLSAAACEYEQPAALRYGIHAPQTAPGAALQTPYCVLLTATSRDDKLWPEEHWQALGGLLAAQGLRCVLPAGSPRERERATRIASTIPGAEVAPPSSLNALASLLAGAAGVVGVDTGLTHLAAALDRPVVALYVATEPGLTGVFAGPQAVNLGGKGQIPAPDTVLAGLQALLAKAKS